MAQPNVLIVDGTALFLGIRDHFHSRQLDYSKLEGVLSRVVHVPGFQRRLFFTTYDPSNTGQTKFLQYVESRLNWTVFAHRVWEVSPDAGGGDGERASPRIRFDSHISYALGRLVGEARSITVVSDSFLISSPISAVSEKGAQTAIAFFGRALDARWHRVLHPAAGEKSALIQLVDLDEHEDELFGSSTEAPRPTKSPALSDL